MKWKWVNLSFVKPVVGVNQNGEYQKLFLQKKKCCVQYELKGSTSVYRFFILLLGGRWKRWDSRTPIKVRIKQGLCHIPHRNIHALKIHLNLPCILSRPSLRRLCCVGLNLLREVSAGARLCSAAPRAPEMLIILCNRFLKSASSCSAFGHQRHSPWMNFQGDCGTSWWAPTGP